MSALSRKAPDARFLFAAARGDGPDAKERDVVFRRVALATGIAVGAAAAATAGMAAPAGSAVAAAGSVAGTAASAGAGATASVFSMKLVAIGGLIGAVSTALGVLIALTLVIPDTPRSATVATPNRDATSGQVGDARPASGGTRAIGAGAKLAAPVARGRDDAKANATAEANANADAANAKTANANADADANASAKGGSDLAEEARLVTAARTALVAGDPTHALALVQATRKLGARALEPEELGLEARALRALGRADDAAATELVLRRRYPDHALAK